MEAEIADLRAYVGYTDGDIYGVEVDFANKKFTRLAGAVGMAGGEPFDKVRAMGGRKRCNLTDDGVVVAYQGDPAFSSSGVLTQAATVGDTTYPVGTKVQVMVEQPKFYYKVVPMVLERTSDTADQGWKTRKVRYYISDTPKAGFKVHPQFICNGKENDYIYKSAYEGCLWDKSAAAYIMDDAQVADFANDMLSSIANAPDPCQHQQTCPEPWSWLGTAVCSCSGWHSASDADRIWQLQQSEQHWCRCHQ